MALVRIGYSANFGDIALMRSLLHEHGILAVEPRMSSHVSVAGVDQGWFLEVLAEDTDLARRLLRENDFDIFVVDPDPGGILHPGWSDG